jgi:hypothetical protein
MSDYSKSTNFTTKDTLPTGNAGKIVKGTELDTEFTAISSAISSKADVSSPALLGTPTSPTATIGTNTTQIASTAFVKATVDALGTIGTMAAQNKTAVDITGGTIVGITDLAVADGGTGQSSYTNGQLLIGNSTGNTLTKATLTAGTGIAITNGTGSISIASTAISASSNTSTSGYITLSNGTIMQWGKITGTTSSQSITFPISFPTNVVSITAQFATTGTSGPSSWAVNSYTNSDFVFVTNNSGQTTFWFAVGY